MPDIYVTTAEDWELYAQDMEEISRFYDEERIEHMEAELLA